jgi:hypothetical protein
LASGKHRRILRKGVAYRAMPIFSNSNKKGSA